jgi:hypothetical protein
MAEIKKGGQRSGAGRKPVQDKKVPVTVYLNKSLVEGLGRGRLVELMLSNLGEIPASEKPPVAQKSLEKENTVESSPEQIKPLKSKIKPQAFRAWNPKSETWAEYIKQKNAWIEEIKQLPI